MGFFDDLKKDLNQAVNELVGEQPMLTEEDVLVSNTAKDGGMSQDTAEVPTPVLSEDDYVETPEDIASYEY